MLFWGFSCFFKVTHGPSQHDTHFPSPESMEKSICLTEPESKTYPVYPGRPTDDGNPVIPQTDFPLYIGIIYQFTFPFHAIQRPRRLQMRGEMT